MGASELQKLAHNLGQKALNFALPPRCVLCGTMDVASVNFCLPCWSTLTILDTNGCIGCGQPLPPAALMENAPRRCANCTANRHHHDGMAAATAYDKNSGAIAMRLKYGKKVGLARPMARQMARHLPDDAADWVLVPVPLHRWRLWRRGFNQAALLAKELTRISGAAVAPDALIRRRATQSLGHMQGEQRRQELKDAIVPHHRRQARVRGHRVVLIDDVITSGATSDACVRALKDAGAASVRVVAWARVIPDTVQNDAIGARSDWA